MIKKTAILVIVFYVLCIIDCRLSFAQETLIEAEKKAKELHELASSDVIFIDEEQKAIYYQNLQIIQLLKEIKELLHKQLERTEEN